MPEFDFKDPTIQDALKETRTGVEIKCYSSRLFYSPARACYVIERRYSKDVKPVVYAEETQFGIALVKLIESGNE